MDWLQTGQYDSFWSWKPFHWTWRFRSQIQCITIWQGSIQFSQLHAKVKVLAISFLAPLIKFSNKRTTQATGKSSFDELTMRNQLDVFAECVCIRNEFGMLTIGAILVMIGIISVPIQIQLLLREMRLS